MVGQLKTLVDTNSGAFLSNSEAFEGLLSDLRERSAEARRGGGEKARRRHEERGKLPVRDRVDLLLDPGTAFLELSPLAAYGMYDGRVPAAGIVTGVGRVSGREVVVVANDATVKGGTYHPMTVKKHLRAQEIAEQNHLPCVYLVDSGGAFLPLQDEVFPDHDHFGRIFYNQAKMSARGIMPVPDAHHLVERPARQLFEAAVSRRALPPARQVQGAVGAALPAPPFVMVALGATIHEFACNSAVLLIETRGWSDQVRP